jgi:hypothetical protein
MSLLFVAADTASKVPFYICGGALVVWALLLAGTGLSRPDFPGNRTGERGVVAITFVLIVLSIGAAILTS